MNIRLVLRVGGIIVSKLKRMARMFVRRETVLVRMRRETVLVRMRRETVHVRTRRRHIAA